MNQPTTENKSKNDRSRSSKNHLKAGLTGAVIGAAAGATAVFLADKENRNKIKQKAKGTVQQARSKAGDLKEGFDSAAQELQQAATKPVNSSSKSNSKKGS